MEKTINYTQFNTLNPTYECKVFVERKLDDIDFLSLKITPHPTIESLLKNTNFISYTAKTKTFIFKIYFTPRICQILLMSGVSVDMSELAFWNNLVLSWNKTYEMIDLSKKGLKFKPYDYQIRDIKGMLEKKVILNANDMGCGKTFESVVVGESLPMKKLVICPATLRLNWEYEIKNVNPEADVKIIYNDKEYIIGKDWTIIGYSSVDVFLDKLINEFFGCVFIDEAHYCCSVGTSGNPESARAKAVLKIAATAGYVYPITGTPKPTRNKDLYNILRIIRHPLAAKKEFFYSYGRNYCGGIRTKFGLNFNGNSNDKELSEKIKPYMIRHLKTEVLPDLHKIRKCIPVTIDLTEYRKNLYEYEALLRKKNSQAQQLQLLMQAKKTLATNKISYSIEMAKELISTGKKVVIVTCFTDVVKKIESAFPNNCVKIIGGMTDKKKQAAKEEFQNGKTQVLVMNIVAGGVGITLTSSSNIIFNDYDWNVYNISQAEDRICRAGQTETCLIHYMTAKGAEEEEKLVDMLTYKSKSITDVVDEGSGEAINFRALVNSTIIEEE